MESVGVVRAAAHRLRRYIVAYVKLAIAIGAVLYASRLTTTVSWASAGVARCVYLAGVRPVFLSRS
jgi:hypothetical protein